MPAEATEAGNTLATYEWDCHGCGVKTWVSHAGGPLDCTCVPISTTRFVPDPERAANMHVYRILAGDRVYLGTAQDIADGNARA